MVIVNKNNILNTIVSELLPSDDFANVEFNTSALTNTRNNLDNNYNSQIESSTKFPSTGLGYYDVQKIYNYPNIGTTRQSYGYNYKSDTKFVDIMFPLNGQTLAMPNRLENSGISLVRFSGKLKKVKSSRTYPSKTIANIAKEIFESQSTASPKSYDLYDFVYEDEETEYNMPYGYGSIFSYDVNKTFSLYATSSDIHLVTNLYPESIFYSHYNTEYGFENDASISLFIPEKIGLTIGFRQSALLDDAIIYGMNKIGDSISYGESSSSGITISPNGYLPSGSLIYGENAFDYIYSKFKSNPTPYKIEFNCEFCDYVDDTGIVIYKKSLGQFFNQGDKFIIDGDVSDTDIVKDKIWLVTKSELHNDNGHKYVSISAICSGAVDTTDYLCFSSETNNEIWFTANMASPWNAPTLFYSYDKNEWIAYSYGSHIQLSFGDKVYFKGDNDVFSQNDVNNIVFESTSPIIVSGDVMTLLSSDGKKTNIPNYGFYGLFNSAKITSHPKISATTIGDYGCAEMFAYCSLLTTAPELPAINVGDYCYSGMFRGTSITTAPELPATELSDGCYNAMFNSCYNLLSMPDLPAETLAPYCYYGMFAFCLSLETAKPLRAQILSPYCYFQMFDYCTSLINAPEILATNISAENCCSYMFYKASALKYVKVNFLDWGTQLSSSIKTLSWLGSVSDTGQFVCHSALPIIRGVNNIPQNWTVENF